MEALSLRAGTTFAKRQIHGWRTNLRWPTEDRLRVCSACVHPAFLGYLRDLWFHRNNNLRRINRAGRFESLSLRHLNSLHLS